jgi:hypothetical protein
MSPTLEKTLLESFPHFFTHCQYIECADGWFHLINDLCVKLNDISPNVEVVQVKQKFGGLRFYTGGVTEEQYKLIQEAEEESYTICEICGLPGKRIVHNGWISVACENHTPKEVK